MSSGKLRREHSRSQDHHSHKEGHNRSAADSELSPNVAELNEEEYDEEWEHEWEDIDEIGDGPKYQKPYGRNQNQKWRGKYPFRGQNRFTRWDNKTQSADSDHGSEGSRKDGRKLAHVEEEESLEMPPGVEMTNLKVKIQDGKRFAEPDELEEFNKSPGSKYQPRFGRGRGIRGFHGVGRDKWIPNNRYKRPIDPVDCREVLNRRKRHFPDPSESDLREKLLRKDPDLGDLREIIESRDVGAPDLRDIIEPPDMSLIDELPEDVVGDIDLIENINLRINNDYFEDSERSIERNRDFNRASYEREAGPSEYVVDEEVLGDVSHDEEDMNRGTNRPWIDWRRERFERGRRGRSRERSFDQSDKWSERGRGEPHEEWQGLHDHEGNMRERIVSSKVLNDNLLSGRGRDISRNRSRERVRSTSRSFRGGSIEQGVRTRDPSWEQRRNFDRTPSRERVRNLRVELDRRGSIERDLRVPVRDNEQRHFSQERGRITPEGNERFPPPSRDQRPPRHSPDRGRRLERHGGPERGEPRMRSVSQEDHRKLGSEKGRGSMERHRRLRSTSRDRGGVGGRDRNQSLGRERNLSIGRDRDSSFSRDGEFRMGVREGSRDMLKENSRDADRETIRERVRTEVRDLQRERNRNSGVEMVQERSREGEREIVRGRTSSDERLRNRSSSQGRNRDADRDRKRSPDGEPVRNSRWGPERSPWIAGDFLTSQARDKSPVWGGPRTPSAERFREGGWESRKSPPQNRSRSPMRERSRSRGRQPMSSSDRRRENSRGKEIQGRVRDLKDKDTLRPKEPERREKVQDSNRRREFHTAKDQGNQETRLRESGPLSLRHSEKDSSTNLKPERNRKREHEETTTQDRTREKPRSPGQQNLPTKSEKKTPLMLVEEFKQRYVRDMEKPVKFVRQEEFVAKQDRESTGLQKKNSFGHNQVDSREWENIRDFQERRNLQPVEGVPFLDEARKLRENLSQNEPVRRQENRGTRNLPVPHLNEMQGHSSSSGSRQKKDQSSSWTDQTARQFYDLPEEERRRSSHWGSPSRRSRPDHSDSHKSASHSTQNISSAHHSSSNGKPDDDFWRRNLPSLGEPQWNKPRSDLSGNSRETGSHRPSATYSKNLQSPKEVIFVRGLARDVTDMDIRKDISACNLWAKDVRVVYDAEKGLSRGLAFITFNSVDEATRWMDLRHGVLNLRPNNHATMEYSNPVAKDWECVRCLTINFKHRSLCYQCNRSKEDCLDGWDETCPYPTHALLLRGLNPLTSTAEVMQALKPRLIAQARLDGVKMGVDAKGRPRSVCFVQLTSVTDSMALHKSLVTEPLIIDNNQVLVAYCQLDKLPLMDSYGGQLHSSVPVVSTLPPAVPPSIHPSLPTNNIPVVSRSVPVPPPPPRPVGVGVSTASIRSMLEGNYTEKDIPTLAQYCASAYAKNPQEQTAYVRYYTKLYKEKLAKQNQAGGK